MTALVINAGLGDLALGLKMAGFEVIAAYEADAKAAAIHKVNMDTPVFPYLPEAVDSIGISSPDLLAAKIYHSGSTMASVKYRRNSEAGFPVENFLQILDSCRPKAFFLLINAAFLKDPRLDFLLSEVKERNFQYRIQAVPVAETTGMPTAERAAFVFGSRENIAPDFEFLTDPSPLRMPPEQFLQLADQVDPYYTDIGLDHIQIDRNGKRFYCWKGRSYEGTDLIRWNHIKIPLVDTGERLRQITHREIANLKGFPSQYCLPDHVNKSWLYRKLMYSVNVLIVKKAAEEIARSLACRPRWSQQVMDAIQFEDLFQRYLTKLLADRGIETFILEKDLQYDFRLQILEQTFYFELKKYPSRHIPQARIHKLCEQMAAKQRDGELILVVTCEISEQTRYECQDRFHISIWDVGNLLWLFDHFEDLKNEFIAHLDYATGNVVPVPLKLHIFSKTQETDTAAPDLPEKAHESAGAPSETGQEPGSDDDVFSWEQELKRIKSKEENEASKEYEAFCVSILKYILADYLSLWEVQQQTADGLHRFDLCCKIKEDVTQDFFDTVKNYFKTKYIVFEFKNYSRKITQKEIYSTEKYLYGTALRRVAILISRHGPDDHALRAIKGSLRENGKLILCLSDDDLLEMADIKARGEDEPADHLSKLLDKLFIHLEK